jgi:hypothetical protein
MLLLHGIHDTIAAVAYATPEQRVPPPSRQGSQGGSGVTQTINWSSSFMSLDEWLSGQPLFRTKALFNHLGFVAIRDLITEVSPHSFDSIFNPHLL